MSARSGSTVGKSPGARRGSTGRDNFGRGDISETTEDGEDKVKTWSILI